MKMDHGNKIQWFNFISISLIIFIGCNNQNTAKQEFWPKEVEEINYLSEADSTYQPALIYTPLVKQNLKRPLLVALHTWSGNYKQKIGSEYANWCIQNDWYLIHPNFRGPNNNPEAMGSELVVKDIVSSVEYMVKNYSIDEKKIYLVGYSGGGYASLLMAGRYPELWAAVSAWNGISDIKRWWKYSKDYAPQIEAALEGKPIDNKIIEEECLKRSPITYLKNANTVKLDINAGVDDETVPFTQSLLAYNAVVNDKDKIKSEAISKFYETKSFPSEIDDRASDKDYGNSYPIFSHISGNTRITIFKGGHEIIYLAALRWLAKQQKNKQPVWK